MSHGVSDPDPSLTEEGSSDLCSSTELQNLVVGERKHLQVYLRIRPFTTAESNTGEAQDCVILESADTVLVKPSGSEFLRQSSASAERPLLHTGQRFHFTQVYGPDTTQKQLYDGTVRDLVKDVLSGGNSLVFTYGVTNAGKTFTFLGSEEDGGILPRSLSTIFNSIEERTYSGLDLRPHRCREVTRLTEEQQAEQLLFQKNIFKHGVEADRNATLLNSTVNTLTEGSVSRSSSTSEDDLCLNISENTRFSVWVSFCEIYNENIHDLLEAPPSRGQSQRRTVLRLSQDMQGNSYVKDLRWLHVNTAEEAYKVLKLGKKNQSFSSTKLNQLSSRSHSIFSIRILRIEDIETLRVSAISELCLCDLAGSERCAKTQNKGERLKEAGNINNSLLILGKCINTLRHNQQAKLLQHVPFRESKLTHYLQNFLCGRSRAVMIVNINQCASAYDETLHTLKFSAVAQQVVVFNERNRPLVPEQSSSDGSFLVDDSENQLKRRRNSLSVWECTLEDLQEDEDSEGERSMMTRISVKDPEDQDNITLSRETYQRQMALLSKLQLRLKQEVAHGLQMESRIREETSKEFSELYSHIQRDFDERLARERDILEERADKRLEIFKNLSLKMSRDGQRDGYYQERHHMDSFSAELAEMENYPESYLPASMGERVHAFDRLEEQVAKFTGESSTASADRAALLSQLQEKSLLVGSLEKQVSQLQRRLEQSEQSAHSQSSAQDFQQAQVAVEKEKRAREEALASLEVEKKARKQAQTSLSELQSKHQEVRRALSEEQRNKDSMKETLEKERKAKEEAMAALIEEKKQRKEAQATGEKKLEEQLLSLTEKNKARQQECDELREKNKARQQECDELKGQVKELTAKLRATESKVSSEKVRGDQASQQLKTTQTQLDKLSSEVDGKSRQIQSLTQEVASLKEELRTSVSSSNLASNLLKDEMSELRTNLASEKDQNKRKANQITQLEQEMTSAKEQLAMEKLMSEQKLTELNEKLKRQSTSKDDMENLRKRQAEKEESMQRNVDELKAKLESQEKEKKQLRAKLEEEIENSKKVKHKMQEQDSNAKKEMEKVRSQLAEQQATSDQLLCDAKLRLYEHQEATDKLRADLELANSKCAALQDCNKQTGDQASKIQELEQSMEAKDKAHREKLAESVRKGEDVQRKLTEREKEVAELKRSLDQRDQTESQAAQETRRMEAERRRELMAKAEEAIAQKDAELEKRNAEVNRLKQSSQQDANRAQSLSMELQRRDEQSNDLQEKLADYKKQLQQVQREISSMREEERGLKTRLTDLEKMKKQLQTDLATRDRTIQNIRMDLDNRDRTIQNIRMEQSSQKPEQTQQLYQNACKELQEKQQLMENMRLALSEQEETQEQMERAMEEKDNRIQQLTSEVDKVKSLLMRRDAGSNFTPVDGSSNDLRVAREEAAQAQEHLKVCTEKHRAERKAWIDEKMSLIGQAKEAEERRNQDMKRFTEDREKYQRTQSQVELLSSQLRDKEQTMEQWRRERDSLVSALEVQLQKLMSNQTQKDKLIQELQERRPKPSEAEAELQSTLSDREQEIQRLKEELQRQREDLQSAQQRQASSSKIKGRASAKETLQSEAVVRKSRGGRATRTSVISQTSVLDSSEISTENGRSSRFPRPELEISFSPLQPNRVALRRQGEDSAVTVKITRQARKRKSSQMEKEEVEAENRRNTRTRVTPKQEEKSVYSRHDSQSSVRRGKEGTLQKIGDFLQSSPTLLGSKAKKMMGLVSGQNMEPSGSSTSLSTRGKKNKRNLHRPEISSPMETPPHPIISQKQEEKESDQQSSKRSLRSRVKVK